MQKCLLLQTDSYKIIENWINFNEKKDVKDGYSWK